ncbi:MAG: hypothetical protein WA853_15260 [Candidatus Acidiferrum sp.]
MLKVYLDRGEKHDEKLHDGDSVASIAATVFKPNPYKQFIRPWNRMLREWNATAFHATDFYSGAEEFERRESKREDIFQRDCRIIPALIGEHIHRVMIVSFRPGEFAEKASPKWREKFGTETHPLAVQLCMVMLGWWRKRNCPSENFAYFHETGDLSQGKVEEAVRILRQDKEYGPHFAATSFTMINKGEARGLEASDFVAWHWNKHYIERLKIGEEEPRKDFSVFMKLSEKKVSSAFITGEKLIEFFRVCDKLYEK